MGDTWLAFSLFSSLSPSSRHGGTCIQGRSSSRDGGTCIQGRSSTFSQPSVEVSQTYPEVCLSDLVGDLKPQ